MCQRTVGPLVAVLVGLNGFGAICRPDEKPAKPEVRTILPGVGLKECQLGGTVADAESLFGKPSKMKGSHVHFGDSGVELSLKDDKIKVIFFYCRDPGHKPFSGKTDKGIGLDNTMEDVQKAYGKPDRIDESVISPFGTKPGAVEHYLDYAKLGIGFTFHDRKLANVRVWSGDK